MKAERILIRGTNWIGDSVMSIAALREIRRLFPGAHLALLVKEWVAGMFRDQDLVDEIILLRDQESSIGRIFRTPSRLRGFDQAILFQNAFEAALIALVARIPVRAGYARDGRTALLTRRAHARIKKLNRHQIYYYLDLLYQTRLSPVNYLETHDFQPSIRIRAHPDRIAEARSLLHEAEIDLSKPLIGLNPGAFFGSAKRWFPDRYSALADRLIGEEGAEVVVLGGTSDLGTMQAIQEKMRHPCKSLVGKTSLEILLGIMAQCRLFITNDSGPMHLAAALDVPQIALFGSTDEIATGPYSARARVIHKHVECSPCLLRECPLDLRCFTRIEVEEVYQEAVAVLNGGK
jgi:heptosyltransferase II